MSFPLLNIMRNKMAANVKHKETFLQLFPKLYL